MLTGYVHAYALTNNNNSKVVILCFATWFGEADSIFQSHTVHGVASTHTGLFETNIDALVTHC